MLKDQVRRSKKTQPRSRSGGSSPRVKAKTRVGRASAPPPAPSRIRHQSRSSKDKQSGRYGWLLILGIFLMIAASLWYGVSQIVAYLTRAATPTLTLLVSQPAADTAQLWLLAESRESVPQYFAIDRHSELTNSLITGLPLADLPLVLTANETPEKSRTMASQVLGLSITRVVILTTDQQGWSSIISTLRQSALSALRDGQWSDGSIRLWLAARSGNGSEEPETLSVISRRLSRQNLSTITTQEHCTVAVLNNSGKPGFASLMGTVIEQNGGTVLRVANALSIGESDVFTNDRTMLFVHPGTVDDCPETMATLVTLLPEPLLEENQTLTEQYRANIVLVLSLDAQVATTAAALSPHP